MIRSLTAYFDEDNQKMVVHRNLERDALAQKIAEGHKLWIDIVDSEEDEIDWLAQLFDLNPAVTQDLKREDRRPALLVYPSYLFLSLFEPHIRLNRVEGQEIHCLVTDNCFVTVRASDTESVDNAYNRVAQNPDVWLSGVAYCLYLTSQYVTDAYYPLLDRVSNLLNKMEENLLNGGLDETSRRSIYRIKQQLINLRQMVAPQREVFSNVIGEKRLAENSNIRDLFRHLYERLLRVYDVIDAQRDLSSNVLDMMQNQESNKMVDAVNRLTIFSMIFLPLTFLMGLFELNFVSMSDPIVLPIPGGFMLALVILAMIGSSVFMTYFLKRRGWL